MGIDNVKFLCYKLGKLGDVIMLSSDMNNHPFQNVIKKYFGNKNIDELCNLALTENNDNSLGYNQKIILKIIKDFKVETLKVAKKLAALLSEKTGYNWNVNTRLNSYETNYEYDPSGGQWNISNDHGPRPVEIGTTKHSVVELIVEEKDYNASIVVGTYKKDVDFSQYGGKESEIGQDFHYKLIGFNAFHSNQKLNKCVNAIIYEMLLEKKYQDKFYAEYMSELSKEVDSAKKNLDKINENFASLKARKTNCWKKYRKVEEDLRDINLSMLHIERQDPWKKKTIIKQMIDSYKSHLSHAHNFFEDCVDFIINENFDDLLDDLLDSYDEEVRELFDCLESLKNIKVIDKNSYNSEDNRNHASNAGDYVFVQGSKIISDEFVESEMEKMRPVLDKYRRFEEWCYHVYDREAIDDIDHEWYFNEKYDLWYYTMDKFETYLDSLNDIILYKKTVPKWDIIDCLDRKIDCYDSLDSKNIENREKKAKVIKEIDELKKEYNKVKSNIDDVQSYLKQVEIQYEEDEELRI